jgi:hypothetical protein
MKKTFTILYFLLIGVLFSDNYSDRLLIYIDNSVQNFQIDETSGQTNIEEINKEMDKVDALSISKWLPYARPTDRDGDIYLNRYCVVMLSSSRSDIGYVISSFDLLESVRSSEVMAIMKPTYVPNDTRWNQQYGMALIEADLAYDLWDIDGGELPGYVEGDEIVVAITDLGLEYDHSDLVGNVWQNLGEDADGDGVVLVQSGNTWIFDPGDENGIDDDEDGYEDNFIGWDVSNNDNDPMPENNSYDHGTNVAGCVSASTNNNNGVASVGWSVKLMGMNNSDDGQYITDGAQSILTAAQMGADVINMSWGSMSSCGGYQSVVNNAYNTYGSILVGSAGNGGDDGNTNFDPHSPSGCSNVISVSAVGSNDNFGCWATAGTTVDLCAPGESVWTTNLNNSYGSYWGTSFSSPITAGAVALLWSRFPSADQDWIVNQIISTTDEFSDMTGSCQGVSLEGMLGTGRLNIYKALTAGVYPSLFIDDINYLNDSDGDGVFNPGEQVKVKLVIGNEVGWADAENVVATISSDDDRIAFIDNSITFNNTIPAGGSSFTLIDHFLVFAFDDAALGDIPCTVHIQAGLEEPYYTIDIDIDLKLSLDQYGFPIEGMVVKSSPLISDVDGNSIGEIYFGSDNGNLYGYTIAGYPQYGFPFSAGDNIRSSVAVGDVDNDGVTEIVFGSYNGKLFVLSPFGSEKMTYTQSGYIIGSPALVDLDGDEDLEIIFTTQSGADGMVYAIHHDGNDVDGFPADISEKMMVGAAVGDIDNDGVYDIVVCTWDDHVYAIDASGNTKSGFPFTSTNRFNAPPTLVDIDGDGYLEIIAGNDNGLLHILNHDGTEMASFNTGDDIRGGISVADLNDDGSLELLFVGYDDMIHVWNPLDGEELEGWPIDMDYNSLTEPVTADLDNDGDLEVVTAMKNGMVYVLHHDGTPFFGFPTNLGGNIESSPAIGDLDGDGDYEIAFGTTQGLQVFDIKTDKGSRESWMLHRGSLDRSGLYSMTLLSTDDLDDITPENFYVSPNYPNPFNPSTQIDIYTDQKSDLTVNIFDATGRLVNVLINKNLEAGTYSIKWEGNNRQGLSMPTGVYFIQVLSGTEVSTQKIVLIK